VIAQKRQSLGGGRHPLEHCQHYERGEHQQASGEDHRECDQAFHERGLEELPHPARGKGRRQFPDRPKGQAQVLEQSGRREKKACQANGGDYERVVSQSLEQMLEGLAKLRTEARVDDIEHSSFGRRRRIGEMQRQSQRGEQ
jgi:hypothetical protein